MIEFLDNLIQVLVTMICCCFSCVYFHRSRKQAYFILAGFYGCFTFAGAYWTLYYLLFSDTPHIFYVSEIGWISGCTLLHLLQYVISDDKAHGFKTKYSWIAALVGIPLMVFYCFHGDILFSVITSGIMILISWYAAKDLVFWYRKRKFERQMFFYILMLVFVILEYCLWIAGDFWIGDTIRNPYFWFDFLLTCWRVFLLYAVKKVVEE